MISKDTKNRLKEILTLSWPILFMTLAQLGMGIVDTIVSSLSSTTDVAAIGLGTAIWSPILLSATAIISALTIINAGLYSANKIAEAANTFIHSIVICIILSSLIIIFLCNTNVWIGFFVQEKVVQTTTIDYLLFVSPSILFASFFQVLRSDLEANKIVKTSMNVYIFGLIINIPLSLFFALGLGTFTGYGAAGCGIATSIAFLVMTIIQYRAWKKNTNHLWSSLKWRNDLFFKLIKLGTPMGASTAMEIGMFSVVTLMIAKYGIEILAAHQITMSITSTIFAIPIAIASALTILIASKKGNLKVTELRKISKIGLILGLSCILITSSITIVFSSNLMGLYTADINVVRFGVIFVTWACIYQIFDMFQAVFIGILRGLEDTTIPFVYMLLSSWVIAIPSGYFIANYGYEKGELSAAGFYQGLLIGLVCVCIALYFRLSNIFDNRVDILQLETSH
jgi:MATE family multidrug resistance protein